MTDSGHTLPGAVSKMKLPHDPLEPNILKIFVDEQLKNLQSTQIQNVEHQELDQAWRHWLSNSLNVVKGLDQFTHSCFSAGTSVCFGEFISRYPNRRVRTSRSDFVLGQILSKSYQREHTFLEDDQLRHNDCLLISLPFSGNGGLYPNWDELLKLANDLEVPVFIDAAYFGISYDVVYDLTWPCIQDVALSLSKNFSPVGFRLGMRFTRSFVDDGVSSGLVVADIFDRVNSYISIQILKNFMHDEFLRPYKKGQIMVCDQLELVPTNTVTLALDPTMRKEFQKGDFYRVCITEELSQLVK
jgi:hypothetical protein